MSTRPNQSERGATAILVALSLILLLGMAAIAVDLGAIANERRQDQSAADVGSLAAVQFAKPTTGTAACAGFSGVALARCNGAQEAMAVVNATLDSPGAAAWTTAAECTGIPAGYTASPITPCVAFNSNLQRAWVRVPTIEVPTTFGRVLGFQAINSSAEAIAVTSNLNRNLLIPFLTPGSYAGGNYNCLKTSGNPGWGVCADLPSTGNFGSADFFLYSNEQMGTTQACTGGTNSRLVSNIARGVDHPLSIHPTGSGAGIEEQNNCPVFSAEPNAFYSQTGVGSNLDDGLTRGGSAHSSIGAYDGRIEQASGGFLVRNSGGSNPATRLDDTPLWNYLVSGLSGACDKSLVDTHAEMVACIAWAKSTSTTIFLDSIIDAKRFGFTPLMWENDISSPSTLYHVKDFLPVYLDTTMYGCNSNSCPIHHTPGIASTGACPNNGGSITCGTPGAANRSLNAVTSYILSKTILPLGAQSPYPGANNQRTFSLAE
ncbi:MAG TPA: pilus assembly protein TadG-related protein [Acidimicrobiia bacterium]